MLSVDEFTIGSLDEAEPLSLMLPRTKYEERILIGRAGQKRVALFLGPKDAFYAFEYDTNNNYSALIITGVTIEVDEATVFDPDFNNFPAGSLIRQGTSLCVQAVIDNRLQRTRTMPLIEGLAALPEQYSAGFLRWHIVLGQGIEKRVLQTIDVAPQASR